MRNTFSLFFALLSPTITIQQLSELSSSSDIFRQFNRFNRRYSRICSSIVPQNSPRNFVCIVPYIVTTEFVNVAYTTRDIMVEISRFEKPPPSINDLTGIFASIN